MIILKLREISGKWLDEGELRRLECIDFLASQHKVLVRNSVR